MKILEHKNRIKNISTFKLLNLTLIIEYLSLVTLNTARNLISISLLVLFRSKSKGTKNDRSYFQSNYSILTNALNSGNIPAMKSAHFNMLNTKYYILDLNSSGLLAT